MTTDPLGIITDVNQQMELLTGLGRDDLIGSPFKTYFTEPERAEAGIRLVLREGKVTNYELTLRAKDGPERMVSFNAATFADSSGQVRGIFASARDITDQAQLQRQLAEERAYNRGLIEASVDGLVTVNDEMAITDVNDTLCRMVGRSRDQLIGSSFPEYFAERGRAAEGVRLTFEAGLVTNYVLTLESADGRQVPVSFNAAVFRAPDGRVQGIFASARDISEQARLQLQLAEQQVYNRSLIEASADALFAIAPDGIITDVNVEATRLTGHSRKNLISSRFADYFTEPDQARAGVDQTLAEGRVLGYELVLVTRQGRRITVSFNAGVFSDTEGRPLGILAGAREISAQKALEQQLRDSEAYTRSLIESSIDALVTTDPLGIITDVNQQMGALTDHRREELIGSPFKDYFTEPDLAESGVRKTLQEGKVTDYELTARSRTGQETVVVYNAATLYDREGKLQGITAAARDVTERKRFERELQEKNDELERANLAKDRFLASMSHELRTPLNAIIGFTGTLLMKLPGDLNGAQETQLRTIQSSAKHLLSIINDLLDLAKLESGKWEPMLEEVSCQQLAQDVVGSLRPLAQHRGIDLTVTAPAQAVTVETDRRALSQILINLVTNAIKFTDQGGVELGISRRRGKVVFEVKDTGIGIKDQDKAKLFRAFEQLEKYGRASHEGTGLGLYISQRLAHLLHGTIGFESEVDRGSTFRLTLPRRMVR